MSQCQSLMRKDDSLNLLYNLCCPCIPCSNGGWFINELQGRPRRVVESFTPERENGSKVPWHAAVFIQIKKPRRRKDVNDVVTRYRLTSASLWGLQTGACGVGYAPMRRPKLTEFVENSFFLYVAGYAWLARLYFSPNYDQDTQLFFYEGGMRAVDPRPLPYARPTIVKTRLNL